MKENSFIKYVLLLVSLFLNFHHAHSQWVLKARFGLGSQDLYGAQMYGIGGRIHRDQNPLYIANGVTVSPVKRFTYGDGSSITYHFDAEAIYNNKVWVGFGTVFNSFVSIGQVFNYSSNIVQTNLDPGIAEYFDYKNEASQIEVKYVVSSPVRKFQINFGYYLFNSSQLKMAIVGHSKKKPFFDFGLIGGLVLVTRVNSPYKLLPIWEPFEDTLTDGSPLKLASFYDYNRKINFGLLGGFNIRFNAPGRHELFTFSFWYEEHFRQMMRGISVVEIGGVGYTNNFYAKGSHWGFKFSFPVFSYNFTKKKFYRD